MFGMQKQRTAPTATNGDERWMTEDGKVNIIRRGRFGGEGGFMQVDPSEMRVTDEVLHIRHRPLDQRARVAGPSVVGRLRELEDGQPRIDRLTGAAMFTTVEYYIKPHGRVRGRMVLHGFPVRQNVSEQSVSRYVEPMDGGDRMDMFLAEGASFCTTEQFLAHQEDLAKRRSEAAALKAKQRPGARDEALLTSMVTANRELVRDLVSELVTEKKGGRKPAAE